MFHRDHPRNPINPSSKYTGGFERRIKWMPLMYTNCRDGSMLIDIGDEF
jgi:hypothetical protein